jgi:hypothetical protein
MLNYQIFDISLKALQAIELADALGNFSHGIYSKDLESKE